jgi:hypothetical protein
METAKRCRGSKRLLCVFATFAPLREKMFRTQDLKWQPQSAAAVLRFFLSLCGLREKNVFRTPVALNSQLHHFQGLLAT